MIRSLILDAGGVMVHPFHGYWDIPMNYRELMGGHAREVGSPAWIAALPKAREHLREDRFVAGTSEELTLRLAFLQTMHDELGWNMSDRQLRLLAEDFTFNEGRYAWFDDVDAYLAKWHKTCRIGVLSDAMPSFLDVAKKHDVQGYFEEIVISTHVGITKPDARMYHAICEKMQLRPEDCLFVDDKICNLEGALACGMRAVQMDRSGRIPLWNGPIVHDFSELDRYMEENP